MTETVWKWLNGREATHAQGFRYRKNGWREVTGPLVACRNGLHVCRVEHLSKWIARDLFVAEYDGELLDAGDKLVVRRCRIVEHLTGWDKRTSALAACDFAERVLPVFEDMFPGDDRPRLAIQAGRDRANGLITAREAARAARAAEAARDAADAWAARDAAAAWAARAAWAAWAARDAAAAWAARDAAAAEAARDAERLWQGERILMYARGEL